MGERRVKVGRLTAFQDADHPSDESRLISPTAETASPRSSAITVEDETFLISHDDERYDKWTRLLRDWPDEELPIYVEAEVENEAESGAESRTARKLVAPQIKRILAVRAEPKNGWHRVVAEASPTFYYLHANHPNKELLPLLRRAVDSGQLLFVFIDPEGEEPDRRTILDVQPSNEDDDRAPPADGNGNGARVEIVTAERIQFVATSGGARVTGQSIEVASHAVLAPAASVLRSVITPDEADLLFDHLKLHPGIPFCFLNDCCVARSHKMSLIMRDLGVASHKVWNYGSGTLQSEDPDHWTRTLTFVSPAGQTFRWTFHTAPVVKVDYGGGSIRERVIDPAVLTGPDTVNVWRGLQGDSAAAYRFSPARIYWRNPHDPGPGIERPPRHMERSLYSHRWEPSCR